MITQKYKNILGKAKPYLFCNAKNTESFDLKPLGIPIDPELIFDCMKTSSLDFFNLITKIDDISFSDQGMGMDRWVLYDCSAMPGAITGLAIPASEIDESLKEKMNLSSNYTGYVPVSMYIAIPTVEKNHWFGHNLSSLNSQLGNKYPGLGLLTKAMGLLTLKITKQYGATQWNSAAINIHVQLAPLKLLTAITPVHTYKNSLTYIADYTEESITKVLSGNDLSQPEISFKLNGSNDSMLEQMQQSIENGTEYYICGRPETIDGKIIYPINEGGK